MKDRYKVYIGVIMAAFLFGTMEIALKIAGSSIDSFQLTAVRFFIGGLLLLPFAIKEMRDNDIRLDIKQFLYLNGIGTHFHEHLVYFDICKDNRQ